MDVIIRINRKWNCNYSKYEIIVVRYDMLEILAILYMCFSQMFWLDRLTNEIEVRRGEERSETE